MESIRTLDSNIYGINWKQEEKEILEMLEEAETPKDVKRLEGKLAKLRTSVGPRIKYKPICEYEGCTIAVSTEHGRAKPFCRNHVLENPYVQDMLLRYSQVDIVADRKRAKKAFEEMVNESS